MQKDVILTPEGLEKLKQEIEYLSTEKRREVAERIKEAREFGDITENSEYDDAKNEQAMLEARIATLEDKLRSASVIDASELSSDVVRKTTAGVGLTEHQPSAFGQGLYDAAPTHRTYAALRNRVYFSVGGGIVADSDPEQEYRETLDKARALITALRTA